MIIVSHGNTPSEALIVADGTSSDAPTPGAPEPSGAREPGGTFAEEGGGLGHHGASTGPHPGRPTARLHASAARSLDRPPEVGTFAPPPPRACSVHWRWEVFDMSTRWRFFWVAAGALLLLGACAAGGNLSAGTASGQPGFWWGLWHGVISPITFLVSLFRDDVGIYEVGNSGAWYDFGFMLGVSFAFGSTARAGAAPARRRERAAATRDASRG